MEWVSNIRRSYATVLRADKNACWWRWQRQSPRYWLLDMANHLRRAFNV
jgi:hypothetical protein